MLSLRSKLVTCTFLLTSLGGASACSGSSSSAVDGHGSSQNGATTPDSDGGANGEGGSTQGHDGGSSSAKAVLFGGYSNESTGSSAVYASDTWAWNGVAWEALDVPGPSGRAKFGMAALHGKVFLFSGRNGGALGDTWSWDGTAWTSVPTSHTPYYGDTAMATLGDVIVLFDGTYTWAFDGADWTNLNVPGPTLRDNEGMATFGNKIVLFGGHYHDNTYGDECLQDTWTWDGTAWTQVDVGGTPPTACDDPRPAMAEWNGKLVRVDGDTFTWDGSSWTDLSSTPTGPDVKGASMTSFNGSLVLFGGTRAVGSDPLADTWSFDGTSWTKLAIPGPPARWSGGMSVPAP